MPLTAPADRRKRKTHNAVLDAAEVLFVRAGYRRTTIDMLAKEADVAVSSIYANFAAGKADVYAALAWRIATRHREHMPTSGSIDDAVDKYVAFHREHPLALRLLGLHDVEVSESESIADAKVSIDGLLGGIVEDVISKVEAEGCDTDARALVLYAWAAINGAVSLLQRGIVGESTFDTMIDIIRESLARHRTGADHANR
jgi:AcrR family transcriptional regulator